MHRWLIAPRFLVIALLVMFGRLAHGQNEPPRLTLDLARRAALADLGVSDSQIDQKLMMHERILQVAQRVALLLPKQTLAATLDWNQEKLLVTVQTEAQARLVRNAGAIARVADPRLVATLRSAFATLEALPYVPGIYSWRIDWDSEAIVVGTDPGPLSPQAEATLTSIRNTGASVRTIPSGPILARAQIIAGERLGIGSSTCTLAFHVQRASEPNVLYGLTAGHCVPASPTPVPVRIGSVTIADVSPQDRRVSGMDIAAIRYRSRLLLPPPFNQLGAVEIHPAVYTRSSPVAGGLMLLDPLPVRTTPTMTFNGQLVCSVGTFTGVTCGRVTATAVGTRIVDNQGLVIGNASLQVETNTCGTSGDSGGPLYVMPTFQGQNIGPIGTLSGTVGSVCNFSTFRSYFQPTDIALSALNMNLIASGFYPFSRVLLP